MLDAGCEGAARGGLAAGALGTGGGLRGAGGTRGIRDAPIPFEQTKFGKKSWTIFLRQLTKHTSGGGTRWYLQNELGIEKNFVRNVIVAKTHIER